MMSEWQNLREILMILYDLHQEASGGSQGGSELGASESSDDPGTSPVCAAAPVEDQPAGD